MEDRKTRRTRERAERKLARKSQAIKSGGNPRKKEYAIALICFTLGIVLSSLFLSVRTGKLVSESVNSQREIKPVKLSLKVKTFGNVLELTPEQVKSYDMAELNLLCGSQLEGTQHIDIKNCLEQLDIIVEMVRKETDRNWYRWEKNPGEFDNSEAYYRMAMLITVIRLDYKCKYNPSLISAVSDDPYKESITDDVFFDNASNVFLQGLLSKKKMGTCASMPVLYTAVARRLGYPVYLVPAKAHLFCRWEDENERRNFEGTGNGIRCDPDEAYRKFPYQISDAELKEGYYLENLSPQQELDVFLISRSACLTAHEKHINSSVSLLHALNLVMNDGGCMGLASSINRSEAFKKIRSSSVRIDAESWIAAQWRKSPSKQEKEKELTRKKFIEAGLRDLMKTNPQDKERIEGLMRKEGVEP